jgi:hypothetical protein
MSNGAPAGKSSSCKALLFPPSLFFPVICNQLLTCISIPLRSWSGVWRPFRGPPTARRPSKNPCPTIRPHVAAGHHPRDLELTELHPLFLAGHGAVGAADRFWLGHLLHESECAAPECCAFGPPALHWSGGERPNANTLLVAAEAVEPRKSHNGRCGSGVGGLHLNADDDYQSPLRIQPVLVQLDCRRREGHSEDGRDQGILFGLRGYGDQRCTICRALCPVL